jgi:hypothetical protein
MWGSPVDGEITRSSRDRVATGLMAVTDFARQRHLCIFRSRTSPEIADGAGRAWRHDARSVGRAMSWFTMGDGRLRFGGRVTKDPIREWLATGDGAAAVAEAARRTRFSLFGRTRAARRRMSCVLWEAISAPAVRQAIAAECAGYVAAWTPLAYAPPLPRLSVEYRRVVVVPRVMIVWRVASRIMARVASPVPAPEVPDAFCAFFSQWVVSQMDQAIQKAGPSPRNPLHAKDSWACVGVDNEMLWVDMFGLGAEWKGHVVMFEMPAPRLSRRDRQAVEAAIARLSESLPGLSRQQRDKTVRLAMDTMESIKA